jgi:hypothetical protein
MGYPSRVQIEGQLGLTATGSEINAAADVSTRAETLTAADTLTVAESGKTYFLNSTTEFAVTLPAATAGVEFDFYVTAAPSGANYTIVSGSANIVGHVLSSDLNASSDGDSEASGATTITLVSAKAVVGDRVHVVSDGTKWYASCFCAAFDAITISGS